MTAELNWESRWFRPLAWIGGIWGLVCALGLAVLRFANSTEPLSLERLLGDLAFTLVYALPFGLALAAYRLEHGARQAAILLGAGVLALLASFTAFSGVSLIFLPAAPLLILAAVVAILRSMPTTTFGALALSVPIAAVLIGVGVASVFILFTLTSDPRCWTLNRYPDGQMTWQRDYASEAQMMITRSPNAETVMGSGQLIGGPPFNGIERVSSICTNDVISPIEALSSMALWILVIGGFWLSRRSAPLGQR